MLPADAVNLSGRPIAVTGATGFLGRYLSTALSKRGAHAVGVVRSPERGANLTGVEWRGADLLDQPALNEAFQGVDAVIANAALVWSGDKSDYIRVNVDGMSNVLRAAVEAHVRRIVIVSSVSVYRDPGTRNHEDSIRVAYTDETLQQSPYAATKARAETLAWEAVEEADLEVTIVRPGSMYGRGCQLIEVFRHWLSGPVALIPCYRHVPLAYAGDVAEAIVRCLERPRSVGRVYNLTGREDQSWRDFAIAWAEAGGPMARLKVPVPRWGRHRYDTSRAEADLDWTNTSFVEGLSETLHPTVDH